MEVSLIKSKEIELKKQIILDEAAKLINKVGFKNAKMEDIAKKVGFSKASLYSYFKDKEEIAMNISKKHVQEFYNRICDLPDKMISAPEKLEIMKNAHKDFIRKSKSFMTIKPNFSLHQKAHEEFIDLKIKTFGILKSVLCQGQHDGVFNKDIDPDRSVNLLESMFIGIVFLNSMINNVNPELRRNFSLEEMTVFGMDFFYMGITNTNAEINKCS